MLITLQKKEKNIPPFFGGRGDQIKLTLFLSGVGNHPTKLYIKFQNDKLKTLGVMSQKDKSQEKPKLVPKTLTLYGDKQRKSFISKIECGDPKTDTSEEFF